MYRRIFRLGLLLLLFSMTACVPAGPEMQQPASVKSVETVEIKKSTPPVIVTFSEQDRQKITDYYQSRTGSSKEMEQGQEKMQELPPDLQKHIPKYSHLPPGLEEFRLPPELENNLPSLPAGYIRIKVGTNVVLLDKNTGVAADVIWNVGR
jgi:hypothetical protein